MLELIIALLIALQGNYVCDSGFTLTYNDVIWQRSEFTQDFYDWRDEHHPLIVAVVELPRVPGDPDAFEDYEDVNLQDYRDEYVWLLQDDDGRIAVFVFDPEWQPHGKCVYFVERTGDQ
jgi:hypothetical protein